MSLTDVFFVKIKIVRHITLTLVMPPDAQRMSDKEAPCGHLSQAVASKLFITQEVVTRPCLRREPHLSTANTEADS